MQRGYIHLRGQAEQADARPLVEVLELVAFEKMRALSEVRSTVPVHAAGIDFSSSTQGSRTQQWHARR
jgi:hypothetical protein